VLRLESNLGAERRSGDVDGYQVVTPSYFESMGVPLIGGRFFADSDGPHDLPVAIVTRRAAQHYWPDQEPTGERFTFDPAASPIEWITVVGVVGDFGATFSGEPIDGQVFLPHAQEPVSGLQLIARIGGESTEVVPALMAAVHGIDPEVPVYAFQTLDEVIDTWLNEDRTITWMVGGTGILALVMASIGLFGMISYSVAQRTREIGVRVALGAHRAAIVRLVLQRSLRLAAIGIALGLVLSAIVATLVVTTIHGFAAPRPATIVAVLALLASVTAIAAYIPARRATRIDPMLALRAE